MEVVVLEDQELICESKSLVRVSVPPRRYASHVVLVSPIHEISSCSLEDRCDALIEDVEIDSKVVPNGSFMEYEAMRYYRFKYIKGVSLGYTLTYRLFQDEVVDLI